MLIGDFHMHGAKGTIGRFLYKNLGSPDFHTHLRTRPLFSFIQSCSNMANSGLIVEVGCGTGDNLIEIARRFPSGRLIGFDLNSQSIDYGKMIVARLGLGNVELHSKDCRSFDLSYKNVSLVLLMDFLEHIPEPSIFLADINEICGSETDLLISVPTPKYSKVFGQKFHQEVGHVCDGFDMDAMKQVLKVAGFEVRSVEYSTGLVAQVFCFLMYNLGSMLPKKIMMVMGWLFSPFRKLDLLNGPTSSCSMFVVARRVRG